jgi:hypothetical protein
MIMRQLQRTGSHPPESGLILDRLAFGSASASRKFAVKARNSNTDRPHRVQVVQVIHFRFDQEAGASQGRHVGKYILRNYLRSEDERDHSDDDE